MSTQNLEELYDDIFDTWMQNFIDSVPLVPTGSSRPQNETNVNESVINNMFNIRRNLQYNSTRTSSRNRAYIPNNASVTMQNGRISDHQNISSDNLDILRTIFNPNGLFHQTPPSSTYSRTNSFGTNRTHTDHTTTTTTTTTTRINGRTTHTHSSTTHRNNENTNEESTQNDTELSDMLSNMTSTIFSSLFGGQAIWLDEINAGNGNETGIPLSDVKVTLSNEQFNKLQRIPLSKCENQTCHICMDEFDAQGSPNDAIKLACSHIFHQDCIRRWLCIEKVTCPVCRADVRESI